MRRSMVVAILLAAVTGSLAGFGGGAAAAPATDTVRLLLFSKTDGYRHGSITYGRPAIRRLAADHGWQYTGTEDPGAFTRKTLRRFDAVIFLNTTGDVLGPGQQKALRRYVRRGGAYVGIHSAADTEHRWPFYKRRLAGAEFLAHPLQQTATFSNEAPTHPATAHLPPQFVVFDEHYSFHESPRGRVRVLLSIDESTYMQDPNTSYLPGGTPATGVMGDHPMAWCQDVGKGRSFYTALGHEAYLFWSGWYLRHLAGGIETATRQVRADCSPR